MHDGTREITRTGLLSLLWLFLTVNFIFCDVFTLMHPPDLRAVLEDSIDGITLSQPFLLGFAVLMEAAMVMIVASRLLPRRVLRPLTVGVAGLLALVQGGSLAVGGVTLHYMFFSVVELATLAAILVTALRWPLPQRA